MKKEDLLELQIDSEYIVYDIIYQYILKVSKTDSGRRSYDIRKTDESSLIFNSLFIVEEFDENNNIRFDCVMSIGMIYIHSYDCDSVLRNLKLGDKLN